MNGKDVQIGMTVMFDVPDYFPYGDPVNPNLKELQGRLAIIDGTANFHHDVFLITFLDSGEQQTFNSWYFVPAYQDNPLQEWLSGKN